MIKLGDEVRLKKDVVCFPCDENHGKVIAITKIWCIWKTESGYEYASKIRDTKKFIDNVN